MEKHPAHTAVTEYHPLRPKKNSELHFSFLIALIQT